MKTSQHMELVKLWDQCSSCVGFCISLGEKFFSIGYKEIDDVLVPLLESKADGSISPRVIPSYAILFWFVEQVLLSTVWAKQCWLPFSLTLQLLNEVGMSTLRKEVLKHFTDVVLKTASKLQSWNDAESDMTSHVTLSACDAFGLLLYDIIKEIGVEEVGVQCFLAKIDPDILQYWSRIQKASSILCVVGQGTWPPSRKARANESLYHTT